MLKSILRETIGLFVDDRSLVAGLLLVVVLIWAVQLIVRPQPLWSGVLLAVALILVFLENVVRAASRRC